MAVELIPRAEVLRESPLLAHVVYGLQAAEDPSSDGNRDYWAGSEAEGAAWFAAWSDPPPDAPVELPPYDGSLILAAENPEYDETMGDVAAAVARMMEARGDSTLTFLQMGRDAKWALRRRTPPVLAGAAAWFRAIGAGKRYNGGIRVDRESLGEMLSALAACVRMDAGYNGVYFAPDRTPWVGSLCQYANLHLDAYGPGEAARLDSATRDAGLVVVDDCGARAPGAIPFRTLRG